MCGGTFRLSTTTVPLDGLSPRVRGNRLDVRTVSARDRSIPACAGEPVAGPLVGVAGGVYPRVCGGTRKGFDGWPARDGLSPRVRGNLRRPAVRRDAGGSIPACAGEPQR